METQEDDPYNSVRRAFEKQHQEQVEEKQMHRQMEREIEEFSTSIVGPHLQK